jgi:hypothetical protein
MTTLERVPAGSAGNDGPTDLTSVAVGLKVAEPSHCAADSFSRCSGDAAAIR